MSELTVRVNLGVRGRGQTNTGPTRRRVLRPKEPRKPRARRATSSRTARLLALAHHIDRLVDDGRLRDYAEAADILGLTRARLTQVMNLVLLAPEIQEAVVGEGAMSERDLRRLSAEQDWGVQVSIIMMGKA